MKKAKKKKTSKAKKLQKQCEKVCKDIIGLRDGNVCMVQRHFPHIQTKHTNIYQVDHCFSRRFKRLFLEIANLTMVCSGCNFRKNYDDAIRLAIYDIVREREGDDMFTHMRLLKDRGGPFLEWNRIGWLEFKLKILKQIREEFEEGIYEVINDK